MSTLLLDRSMIPTLLEETRAGVLPLYALLVAVLPHGEGLTQIVVVLTAVYVIHLLLSMMQISISHSLKTTKRARKKLLRMLKARAFFWLGVVGCALVASWVGFYFEWPSYDAMLMVNGGVGFIVIGTEVREVGRYIVGLPEQFVSASQLRRSIVNLLGLITGKKTIVDAALYEIEGEEGAGGEGP